MKEIKLSKFEQEIEDNIQNYIPISKTEEEDIKKIIAKGKQRKTITLSMPKEDLEGIRIKAKEEGLPYQTLIISLVHKYVTNRLVAR